MYAKLLSVLFMESFCNVPLKKVVEEEQREEEAVKTTNICPFQWVRKRQCVIWGNTTHVKISALQN